MEDRIQDIVIPQLITELSKEGIKELPDYEQKLRDNSGNVDVFNDLLCEAETALMFSHYDFLVTMQESPDISIERHGKLAYVEVKHFRKKEQDIIDEQSMRESEDLVPVGILTPTEGAEAWEQIVDVAICKVNQYREDAPNILVIATSSNSVNGIKLQTAANLYNEKASSNPRLHKLNAFILIDQQIVFLSKPKNVYFCKTASAATPLSIKMANSLDNIHLWETPWNIISIGYR